MDFRNGESPYSRRRSCTPAAQCRQWNTARELKELLVFQQMYRASLQIRTLEAQREGPFELPPQAARLPLSSLINREVVLLWCTFCGYRFAL